MAEQPYIVNPSAVGNPDETPIVHLPPALVDLLNPCQNPVSSRGGEPCGGVNRFHAYDCPRATEGRTFDPAED